MVMQCSRILKRVKINVEFPFLRTCDRRIADVALGYQI